MRCIEMIEETAEHFWDGVGCLRGMLYRPVCSERPVALVMCPPFGEERKSAARIMTLAARALARRGVFVLRFDYYGTGESDGKLSQASVDRWLDDIRKARKHLAARSGVRSVGVLGIRFGATLAALLSTEQAPLPLLVLWGPLLWGGACIEETRRHLDATRLVTASRAGGLPCEITARSGGWDMGGFRLTNRFARNLERIVLPEGTRTRAQRVVLVVFSGRRDVPSEHAQLAEKLTTPSGDAHCLTYPARPFWVTASRYDPTELVERTCAAVDGGEP